MVSPDLMSHTSTSLYSHIFEYYSNLILFAGAVENAFAYFWITDSCPLTVKALANKAPFEVLSLAGSIANALQI